ncbi:hypothetical protein DIPPA_29889 [Diplonema papillatum]|nr:hypothetical protein DIPPA_29889 [Diplonema papillatum]
MTSGSKREPVGYVRGGRGIPVATRSDRSSSRTSGDSARRPGFKASKDSRESGSTTDLLSFVQQPTNTPVSFVPAAPEPLVEAAGVLLASSSRHGNQARGKNHPSQLLSANSSCPTTAGCDDDLPEAPSCAFRIDTHLRDLADARLRNVALQQQQRLNVTTTISEPKQHAAHQSHDDLRAYSFPAKTRANGMATGQAHRPAQKLPAASTRPSASGRETRATTTTLPSCEATAFRRSLDPAKNHPLLTSESDYEVSSANTSLPTMSQGLFHAERQTPLGDVHAAMKLLQAQTALAAHKESLALKRIAEQQSRQDLLQSMINETKSRSPVHRDRAPGRDGFGEGAEGGAVDVVQTRIHLRAIEVQEQRVRRARERLAALDAGEEGTPLAEKGSQRRAVDQSRVVDPSIAVDPSRVSPTRPGGSRPPPPAPPAAPAAPVAAALQAPGAYVLSDCGQSSPVRAEPRADAAMAAVLHAGAEVVATAALGSWLHLSTGGWVDAVARGRQIWLRIAPPTAQLQPAPGNPALRTRSDAVCTTARPGAPGSPRAAVQTAGGQAGGSPAGAPCAAPNPRKRRSSRGSQFRAFADEWNRLTGK